MSLTSSIQLANNALRAQQIGLQVVGQNIANANTPGYIREEVLFVPAPTQRMGNLLLGLGVQVDSITQKIDHFLEERLRGASSDRASFEKQESTYFQLEALIGELGDTDLSTSMNNFFAAIGQVLNQPESIAVRNLAVLQGRTLADDINRLDSRTRQLRLDANDRVVAIADDINRLVNEVTTLNMRIAQTEGGSASKSQAVGLRDQRLVALTKLSELIDIKVQEQPSGGVTVLVGGEYLVAEGQSRDVKVHLTSDRGLSVAEIRIAETDARLQSSSGELGGLMESRDAILGGFLDTLDDFARAFVFEFNQLFSSGQGMRGYRELVSGFSVNDANEPLDATGLPFTPVNGSFEVQVFNQITGLTKSTVIDVDLNGLDGDSTLASLAAQLDAVDGISVRVLPDRRLEIKSDSTDQEFTFGNDTSGLLAALGINVFFTGSHAGDLGVHASLLKDPALFAASRDGIGGDTANAVDLANFLDRPLSSKNGQTLGVLYERMAGEVTQASATVRSVTDGFRVFEQTLHGQKLAISGVSLDEEAVRMMSYQRAFQASARYIRTLDELLGVLVNL